MPHVQLTAALWALTVAAPALAQDVPIVYVRCPRTEEDVVISGEVVISGVTQSRQRVLRGADLYDVLPDVVHFFGGFSAPCDLVHRDAGGSERILFDCTSTSTATHACAAMDPAVSFDARTVAFAVFRGPLTTRSEGYPARLLDSAAENATTMYSAALPNETLAATEAQLHLVDLATGMVRALPHTGGDFDSGPAWLSNGRLAFTSTRGRVHRTLVTGSNTNGPASQLYTMDPDGRNLERASHHALASEQHPLQLMDGRVAVSSWQLFGLLPFRTTNGAPGGVGTLSNFFHIYAQHPDGAANFALFGQHTVNKGGGLGFPAHDAGHFLGQSTDGRVWSADYYRANNNGMGTIIGFTPEPEGSEGYGPDEAPALHDIYRPRDFVVLAPWAGNADFFSAPMPAPEVRLPTYADPLRFVGKLTQPSGLPENRLLVVWGVGACSTVATNHVLGANPPPLTSGNGSLVPLNVMTHLGADNPGCDAGIYRTTTIPSTHPSDLELVVNRREYHEIMPRAAVPYRDLYGIEAPVDIPRADVAGYGEAGLAPGTPFGILGASSIIYRETRSLAGHPFAGETQWGLQGTDAVDYGDDELCGVRILAVQPNRPNEYGLLFTSSGERLVILGELPVRKGAGVLDAFGLPDTSFKVRFPATAPYLMQGIDCAGHTLNTDQTWQHLRPGEVKVCGGCHVHGKPGMPFESTAAAKTDYMPVRLGEGVVPLLDGVGADGVAAVRTVQGYGVQIEFARDVMPIFASRCTSCHGGSAPAAGLPLDAPGTGPGSTWDRLIRDKAQAYVPAELRHPGGTLRKPQLSKYVRFMASRGSLLYWKAANRRTDGRTDAQYGASSPSGWHDVDFGAAHPSAITTAELATLARWIDTGGGAGEDYLIDTIPPTLSLAADVVDGAVVRLHVGTTDVGSGVDVGSLEVCVVDLGGGCGGNLAPAAAPHGIVTIELDGPWADVDMEVRATVRDLAGQSAELQYSIGWFLSLPPRQPAPEDGGAWDETPTYGEPVAPQELEGTAPVGSSSVEASCACSDERGGVPMLGALAALWLATRRRRWRLLIASLMGMTACDAAGLATLAEAPAGGVPPGAWEVRWELELEGLPTYPYESSIAYDPAARQIVQHGGHVPGSYVQSNYTHTYEVDGAELRGSVAPSRPQRRCLVDLTYVAGLRRVLTGNGASSHGSLPQGRMAGDWRSIIKGDPRGPWLYDTLADRWEDTRVIGAEWQRMPNRQLAYDVAHDAVVYLAGDALGLYSPRANTLRYRALPAALVGRRAYGIAADDSGRVVLFGGSGPLAWSRDPAAGASYEDNVRDDTWLYDVGEDTWTQITTPVRPPKGMPYIDFLKLDLVFHPPTGRFLLYTVPLSSPVASFNEWPRPELWALSVEDASWERVPQAGDGPEFPGLLAYARHDDRLVLFGGGRDGGGADPRPALSRQLWSARVAYPRAAGVGEPLALPVQARTVAGSTAVILTWEGDAAGGYDIYRADGAPFPGPYQLVAEAQESPWTDDVGGVAPHAYRVTRHGEPLARATSPAFNQPVRPSGLAASVESATRVALTWAANLEEDVAGYHVFRASGNGWARLTTSPVAMTSWTDTAEDLGDGKLRAYHIVAVNHAGLASGASPVSYTAPDAPQSFAAALSADGKSAVLTWTAPTGQALAGYFVYWADHHENTLDYSQAEVDAWWSEWQRTSNEPLTSTRLEVPLPDATRQYYFYVRALNVMGQEGFFTDIASPSDQRFVSAVGW